MFALSSIISALAAGAAAVTLGVTPPASAPSAVAPTAATRARTPAAPAVPRPAGVVFVQNNGAAGNSVTVYDRMGDGTLSAAGTYRTGGLGGSEQGAVVDPLASQGSLTYDARRRLLYAVNAGSNTISVFGVRGDILRLRQILPSGGQFPVSVAVSGDLVYVLDAGGQGAVSGFVTIGRLVAPLPESTRTLGLGNDAVPAFLKAPSQVTISPDRRHLIVATKTHDTLDVFGLGWLGEPSATPTVNPSVGAVPFALTFDRNGNLQVANASGSASSYRIGGDGTLALVSGPVGNGQVATCWSVTVRGRLFTANAGSASISSYRIGSAGELSLLDAVAADTHGGPVDLAVSGNGEFLYQQATGAGAIDEYRIHADGSLTGIGAVTGLPADNGSGAEGIAAS